MIFEIALRTIGATACVVIAVLCGRATYELGKNWESPAGAFGALVAFGLTVAAGIAAAACAFYNI